MASIKYESCRYTEDVPEWVRSTCAKFAVDKSCSVTIRKEIATLYMSDGSVQHEESYVARVKRNVGKTGSVAIDTDISEIGGTELLQAELESLYKQVSAGLKP